jgi:hypothetical protein
MRRAASKAIVEDPLLRVVRNFEQSVAVDKFNERVYAELFLTPRSDPRLGLVPTDVYTPCRRTAFAAGGGQLTPWTGLRTMRWMVSSASFTRNGLWM